MKVAFWVLALIFALFALVQYNDPDPLLWALLYGGVAVHFTLAALGKLNRTVLWLWLGISVAWMITLVPAFLAWMGMGMPNIAGSMQAEEPHIELTREFLGLAVAALACGWLLWKNKNVEGEL